MRALPYPDTANQVPGLQAVSPELSPGHASVMRLIKSSPRPGIPRLPEQALVYSQEPVHSAGPVHTSEIAASLQIVNHI
jgi:hypothetical protein